MIIYDIVNIHIDVRLNVYRITLLHLGNYKITKDDLITLGNLINPSFSLYPHLNSFQCLSHFISVIYQATHYLGSCRIRNHGNRRL